MNVRQYTLYTPHEHTVLYTNIDIIPVNVRQYTLYTPHEHTVLYTNIDIIPVNYRQYTLYTPHEHRILLHLNQRQYTLFINTSTKYQGCGSGSGRIRNVFLGSGSCIIIPDPGPTNIKTYF